MIIEQSKEQMHDAIALHTRASIGCVRLAQARTWSQPSIPRRDTGSCAFDIDFKPGAFRREGDHLTIDTDFKFTLMSGEQESQPLFLIECQFEAQYALAEGFDPSEQQIQAFQSANAVFNCWPFFREFVQNTATRMNFPPPPVPFLRIVRKPELTPETDMTSSEARQTRKRVVRVVRRRNRQ